MPVAKTGCARPAGHRGRHRTRAGLAVHYADSVKRGRAVARRRYEWLDAYKCQLGCARCGYREDPRALDFDHDMAAVKNGNISRLIRYAPWPKVLAEMAKCTLLCANCHRVKTFFREQRRPGNAELPGLRADYRITPQDDELIKFTRHHLPGHFPG